MKTTLCFILLGLCVLSKTFACIVTEGYIVQIENLIPNSKVFVHCWSSEDDLGDHWLTFKQEEHWRFCQNFFKTTKFLCHFEWDMKEQDVVVFDAGLGHFCAMETEIQSDYHPCNWSTMNDGIYWNHNNTWLKNSDWKSKNT